MPWNDFTSITLRKLNQLKYELALEVSQEYDSHSLRSVG